VPRDTPYESVAALYPALNTARPGSVHVLPTDTASHDIGTPADYYATSMAFAEREGTIDRHPDTCCVAPTAAVRRSILWDDVTVGDGAALDTCVVTDGVSIPPGTSWARQIIRRLEGDLGPGETAVGNLAVSDLRQD
jgi:NDP-sugar pyrophosphorylase family protein